VNLIGVANIAPAVMTRGTQENKEHCLAPILSGVELWSQGMSQPEAGSDLASPRAAAVLDGDHFVVNGQETWNSLGHLADFCQLYVRTDPEAPEHRGISCLLIDMTTPGIEIRPSRTMTGEVEFAEVLFTDAVVPAANLLGTLNEGWREAVTALSFERAGVAQFHQVLTERLALLLVDAAGRPTLADPLLRDRIARLHSQIAGMRFLATGELQPAGSGETPSFTIGSIARLQRALGEEPRGVPGDKHRRRGHGGQPAHRRRARAGAPTLNHGGALFLQATLIEPKEPRESKGAI
jgi:alkylation response protein AidB-like acyl-CoA dehydrogenase